MIAPISKGGLGSQLQRWAVARGIAAELGQPVAMAGDATRLRAYVDVEVVPKAEPNAYLCYDENARAVLGELREHIDGIWFGDEPFAAIKEEIRAAVRYAPRAVQSRTVGVHVRRGDYIGGPWVELGPAYYRRAADLIAEELGGGASFVIVSDDIEWCRANLQLEHPHTFSGGTAEQDFMILRSCRHHIIANSTFGWWAAWLAAHKDQIVVAPEQWFRGWPHDVRAKGMVPAHWYTIPVT